MELSRGGLSVCYLGADRVARDLLGRRSRLWCCNCAGLLMDARRALSFGGFLCIGGVERDILGREGCLGQLDFSGLLLAVWEVEGCAVGL